MAFKIFKKTNYFYIVDSVTDVVNEGLAKDVKVKREKTDSTSFSFENVNGIQQTQRIAFADIVDENGDDYADVDTFVAWYEEETGFSGGGSTPETTYKVYVALLTQTGTDAPVANILMNTLGQTPIWSYDDVGRYILTLANTDYSKVFIPTPHQYDLQESMVGFMIQNIGDDGYGNTTIRLQQCDLSTYGEPLEFNGFASSPQFKIEVYQ